MTTLTRETMQELSKPFQPDDITWRVGSVSKRGDKASALAYADLRAYQRRLDEIVGPDWQVTFTPWGDRIICNLTILGILRSSSGEGDAQAEKSEIAGTSAEAQAFKRACSMFGLGRYLYDELDSPWVEIDEYKKFTDAGLNKLKQLVNSHYARAAKATVGHRGAQAGQPDRPAPVVETTAKLADPLTAGQQSDAEIAVFHEEQMKAADLTIGDAYLVARKNHPALVEWIEELSAITESDARPAQGAMTVTLMNDVEALTELGPFDAMMVMALLSGQKYSEPLRQSFVTALFKAVGTKWNGKDNPGLDKSKQALVKLAGAALRSVMAPA